MATRLYVEAALELAAAVGLGLLTAAGIALPVALVVHLARRRPADGEPRCRRCGYLLIGLPEPRCPECGTPFTPGAPSTTTVRRLTFVQRWCVATGICWAAMAWVSSILYPFSPQAQRTTALMCAFAYLVIAISTNGVWLARSIVMGAFGAAIFLGIRWHSTGLGALTLFCIPPATVALFALARLPAARISRTGPPPNRPP